MHHATHFRADRIWISPSELAYAAQLARENPAREIGGDLFGHWTHTGAPSVSYALGPGPAARCEATRFYQDRKWLIGEAAVLRNQFGLMHIGQWHTHPGMELSEPSEHDAATVRRAIDRYALPGFVLVILNLFQSHLRARAFLFTAAGDERELNWQLLDAPSAVRSARGESWPFDAALPELAVAEAFAR